MPDEQIHTSNRDSRGFPWRRVCIASALAWTLFAALSATPLMVGTPEDEPYPPFLEKLVEASPAPLVWAILTPLACWWSHRHPVRRPLNRRLLRSHAMGLILWLVAFVTLIVPARFLLLPGPMRVEGLTGEWGLASWWWYTLIERVPGEIIVYFGIVALWSALENAGHAARLSRQITEARLQALTAQIHPHFLFNTLNTIAEMAESGETDRVRSMTVGLSDLLRRSLQTGSRRLITLGEELEFLEAYLEIEQVRFGDRVDMHISAPPEIINTLIPPMILQPIVENAVKHGAARTSENAVIEISARIDGSFLVVDVFNAPGRVDQTNRDSGIGIRNVQDRLLEMYGDEHEFSISNRDLGVCARISLPCSVREQTGDQES